MNYLQSRIQAHCLVPLHSTAVLLMLAAAFAGCSPSLPKKPTVCVIGGLEYEQHSACMSVQRANEFFQIFGLDFPEQLTIVFMKQDKAGEQLLSIGAYYPGTNTIIVMDYQSAVAASFWAPPAFGVQMNIHLWRSYLVHEISHAITERHYIGEMHNLAPTEYIAAVAQLSTMPRDLLGNILSENSDLQAFKDETEITDLYYFMKPCEFAVRSYLHYSNLANGQEFIRYLLHGGLSENGAHGDISFF